MGIFIMTLLLFALICAATYILQAMFERIFFGSCTDKQLTALKEVDESHVWWLSRVIYSGFAALCLFLVATLIGVEISLREMASVIFHLTITAPISALVAALGYTGIRFLFCRFWIG